MSENKFIRHLQGKDTAKSVLEIRNQKTPTSFANMPDGTSNANDVYSDRRGDAAGVLKGTENWKLNNSLLIETSTVYGDGRDFTDDFEVGGSGLWVNATCTFTTARRFAPNTKFVLKLCGHDLDTVAEQTVGFTLIVKFGSTVITKVFSVPVQAFDFCKEFEIDFGESNSSAIKVAANSTMQVQLLCADANAQATIYNGMTVFTALQRRVDSETVSSDTLSLDEIETDLTTHIANKNNPHEVTKAQVGLGNCDNTSDLDKPISTATQTALDGKVNDTGDTLTGMYKHEYGSRTRYMAANSTVNYTDLFMNGQEFEILFHTSNSIYDGLYGRATNGYVTLYPGTDNQAWLGLGSRRWNRIFVTQLCPDSTHILTIPEETGTLATKADVDLAANSGSQLYTTGVWYAKMYAATVVPTGAEYNGRKYADFSQVDSENNPVIKIYTGASGAWTLTETITPPATYNGYITVTSKIWDIAEQADQQGGEVLWDYTHKTFTPYPKIVSLLNQANTDLSNLTSVGQNIGNWSSNVSNCVTEIPQDINLELNNGTLTLKAGSKLYVPNGSGTFDILTLTADKTTTQTANDTRMYFYNGSYIEKFPLAQCYSGDTAPSGQTYMFWYDTVNNLMKMTTNGGSTWTSGWSLPFCIATASSGALTSIDQVFNGFGYIGSSRFFLPGVKVLIPNGLNSDGTLNNIPYTQTTVNVYTWPSGVNTKNFCTLGVETDNFAPYYEQTTQPTTSGLWYNPKSNLLLRSTDQGATWVQRKAAVWAEVMLSSGTITSFSPKTVFHAVDYNDFQTLGTSKANTSLDNVSAGIDFVVESQLPTAQNNYTWYRKYKSGWVEQGGYLPATGSGNTLQTVNLPKAMSDAHYTVTTSITDATAGYASDWYLVTVQQQTSTGFKTYTGSDWGKYWSVSGMAA